MKWIGQNIYDLVSKFRNTVDFSEDVTFYQPVNDGNPAISIGSSATDRLVISTEYHSGAQTMNWAKFTTHTTSSSTNAGRFGFYVDETLIMQIKDAGISLFASMGLQIGGIDILTDSSGTTTLNNIDALDATTISTLNAALTAGDITGVTAGTGLSGGGTSGAVTLNVDAAQTQITSVGTIGTGTWQGTPIDSEYLDSDTAHLSGTQTFTGTKSFTEITKATFDGDKGVTPGDGAVIHVDAHDVTDTNTSGSGTAAMYTHVNIEPPRIHATNASVTTTAAASLYIKSAPTAGTNQTLTNAYALWVDAGLVKFDGALTVDGTITGDVTGALTGQADTVATIAGLAPNTATTQATQPNIESIGTDGDTLAILADQLQMSNATSEMPTIKLTNTTDDDASSELIFEKLRDDDGVATGQNLGAIWFRGQDANQATEDYAYIIGEIDVSLHTQESGKLTLGVANHDGGNGAGLILTGGSEDNEIDVTVGLGANSVVTIPGDIDLAGDIDVDGTLETDALTIDGAAVLAQATASAVGAVELATTAEADTGTDTTRAITPAGLKSHVDARYSTSYLHFACQSTMLSSGNWVGPSGNGLNHHVWNLDYGVNTETNDTSAASISRIYAQSGIRMPVACVIDGFSGMSRNAGGGRQVTVGLFLSRAADGNLVPFGTTTSTSPKLQCHADTNNDGGDYTNRAVHYEVTGANLAMAAGDVLYPAIKLTGVTGSGDTDNTYSTITIAFKTLIA